MIDLIDTVGNALKADTALTALVGGRVSYIRPATTPTLPYITYFEVTNDEVVSADDTEYSDSIEIQVDIWTLGSTIPIKKAVQKVLRPLGFTHQAMPDMYDETTKIFHKSIRFFTTVEI